MAASQALRLPDELEELDELDVVEELEELDELEELEELDELDEPDELDDPPPHAVSDAITRANTPARHGYFLWRLSCLVY
jgi:hypothetical protein